MASLRRWKSGSPNPADEPLDLFRRFPSTLARQRSETPKSNNVQIIAYLLPPDPPPRWRSPPILHFNGPHAGPAIHTALTQRASSVAGTPGPVVHAAAFGSRGAACMIKASLDQHVLEPSHLRDREGSPRVAGPELDLIEASDNPSSSLPPGSTERHICQRVAHVVQSRRSLRGGSTVSRSRPSAGARVQRLRARPTLDAAAEDQRSIQERIDARRPGPVEFAQAHLPAA